MKLETLLETPIIHSKELTFDHPIRPFISQNTLENDFDIIHKGISIDGSEYWVLIRKNNEIAFIGIPGLRDQDKKPGMIVYGYAEFKHTTKLFGTISFSSKNVIQISLVRISDKIKRLGYGFYLYLSLAEAGYIVISDNEQYIGGKELWKKIAKLTVNSKYKVYIIENGKVKLDTDNNPITYDGSNIDDSELWSSSTDKKYTLFALRSEIS